MTYGVETGLLEPEDVTDATNQLLDLLGMSFYEEPAKEYHAVELERCLQPSWIMHGSRTAGGEYDGVRGSVRYCPDGKTDAETTMGDRKFPESFYRENPEKSGQIIL